MDSFKISQYKIGEPQTLIFQEDFKPGNFAGSLSAIVIHQGQEKYWNASGYVVDKVRELGIKRGDTFCVALGKNEKNGKSFTEVALPGDIVMQQAPQTSHTGSLSAPEEQDWKKEKVETALGKCRSLLSIEAFRMGMSLNPTTVALINTWAQFCLDGQAPSK